MICQNLRRGLMVYLRWLDHGHLFGNTTDYRAAGLTITDLHPYAWRTPMANGVEGSDWDTDDDDDGPPPLVSITPEAD